MKLQGHSNTLQTNVQAQTQSFGIGDASKIITILRDKLYEHKIRTLVQEYISNSRDAHRECGKGNNFEITVPTRLNPIFKVRDFGPGITPDRMAQVFILYGASTKNADNVQTGGFGIGSKSAFSYTDSFTIISTVDGTRRTYVAHTGVDNNGRLDLISTDQVDEPNGTEIQVAVKPYDISEFREAVFRAIYFWTDKPILKGELSPPVLTPGDKISDMLEIIDNNLMPSYASVGYSGEMLAVIDGIPYRIGRTMIEKVKSLQALNEIVRKSVILHMGNGVVEVSASRESISDSKLTLLALEKLGSKALLEAQTHITTAFGKIKSTPEYLQTYATLSKSFNVDSFSKYKGYLIESGRIKSPLFKKVKLTLVHCLGRNRRSKIEKITKDELSESLKEIDLDLLDHLFFVSTAENKVVQGKRIREYFIKNTRMILVEVLNTVVPRMKDGKPVLDKENKQVFDPISYPAEYKQVIAELGAKDFSSITYVELPREAKAKIQREDAEICLHGIGYGTRHRYTTLATNTQKWIYVPLKEGQFPEKFNRQVLDSFQDYLETNHQTKVCGLADRAIKMVAGDANFISIADWLAAYKPTKNCLLAAKNQLAKGQTDYSGLYRLKDLEDPFVVEMVDEYKTFNACKGSLPQLLADMIGDTKEVKEFKEKDEKFVKLMKDEYPLVGALDTYSNHRKELAFYINAKYKANKKSS